MTIKKTKFYELGTKHQSNSLELLHYKNFLLKDIPMNCQYKDCLHEDYQWTECLY